jgi:hypothetical protein
MHCICEHLGKNNYFERLFLNRPFGENSSNLVTLATAKNGGAREMPQMLIGVFNITRSVVIL